MSHSVEAISLLEASQQALEALLDSIDDVRDCLNQNLPHAGYARYDRRIEAYREQLAKHEKAITDLTAAIAEAESRATEQAEVRSTVEKQSAERGEPVARSSAYDMIDRFLQNNLNSDEDYAEYSKALDSLYTTPPAAQPAVPEGWKLIPIAEHIYNGGCPEPDSPDDRDPDCPACRTMMDNPPNVATPLAAQPAPVPEDMKLVPLAPTDAMVAAYDQAKYSDDMRIEANNVWAAMVNAAPPNVATPLAAQPVKVWDAEGYDSLVQQMEMLWTEKQRLTALVRAQQITIEKLEAQP